MARISAVELERLKREISVQRLFEVKGVDFEKRGADVVGRCLFCEGAKDGLVVTPAKNLFRCSGCEASGSVIDFVMKAEGVTFRHAIELLREGVDLSGPVGPRVATIPKLPCPVDGEASDATLLGQVRDYYHSTLMGSPEALGFLEKRGLKSAELISHFKLGFANRTLGLRMPDGNRLEGAKLRGRLQQLGVMRESGHENLNGSLVVPLESEEGAVVGLYGRKVTQSLRVGTPPHVFLPALYGAAFNSKAMAGQRSVILCSSMLDALTFWAAGFRNVTSTYDVDTLLTFQIEAFLRHRVRDVIIAFSRDDAGEAAAEHVATKLGNEKLQCWRVLFPRGLDANGFAQTTQPAAKNLAQALRQAAWVGKGIQPGMPDITSSPMAEALPEPSSPASLPVLVAAPDAVAPIESPPVGSNGKENIAIKKSIAAPEAEELLSELLPAPTQAPDVETEVRDDEVLFHFGPRRYRVRGLGKALSAETLKVNLFVSVGEAFHIDTLDMYAARQRASFLRQGADELRVPEETLKRDFGLLLLKLEEMQEANLKAKLAPKNHVVADEEREAALELLKKPQLLELIVDDFQRCGVVGEETNKLVGYLATISRKLDEPLAVLIQSSSAAGKSSLMEAVLAFVPEEEKTKYSAMTGQSLFYMGDADLKHKVLAVVEEEGASSAAYALKLLQSEGELTIASTGKNPSTGKLETHEYRVEGPTQLFLTTTASEIDEELLNRCLVLTVDEERAQTRAIHQRQKEKQTLEGLLAKRDKDAVLKLHQNAQRLLRPLAVVNPYARQLTFLDERTRARRDFPKYLTLIKVIALLHQFQRPTKTVQHLGQAVEYVEVQLEDIAVANRLAHAVLGRSLDDLPPQTRRLLTQLDEWVKKGCALQGVLRGEFRFTRRQVREAIGFGDTQLKLHLGRLLEFEYLRLHRGREGGFEYQLLYEGQGSDGGRFLVGLVDVEALRHGYDGDRSGSEGSRSGAGRPLVGPLSGGSRGASNDELLNGEEKLADFSSAKTEKALLPGVAKILSYPNGAAR